MTDTAKTDEETADEIRVLVFSIKDTWFGIIIDQLAEIKDLKDQAASGEGVSHFHELVSFSGPPPEYRSPHLLYIKGAEKSSGIVIEQPDSILEITPANISPLPEMIKRTNPDMPAWGVAMIDTRLILLVDANRFT